MTFKFILCNIVGIYFISIGIYKISIYYFIKKTGIKTVGFIKQVKLQGGSLFERKNYTPIIEFQDNKKQFISGTPINVIPSYPSWYNINREITIYYKVNNSTQFVIKKWQEHLVSIFIIIAGAYFIYNSFIYV